MRLYLLGPMTGYDDFNAPAFRAAADVLRERGHEIVSPVEMDDEEGFDHSSGRELEEQDYTHFLARDFQRITQEHLAGTLDGGVALDGWQASRGAKGEARLLQSLGHPIYEYAPDEETGLRGPVSLDPNEVRIVNQRTGGAKGQKLAQFNLLPFTALSVVAEHYARGAKKYEPHNWRQGYDWSLSFDSLVRHLGAFWEGEDIDPETGSPHMAAVAFHALALIQFGRDFPELDDRPRS